MATMSIFFMLALMLIQRKWGYARQLGAPDYESQWHSLKAQNPGKSDFRVRHGLGEVPLLVDVQVQTLKEPNKNFIFSAVGGCPRNDDMPEFYGGVIYIYNDQEVIVSSPIVSNGHASGSAVYTANNSYFSGSNTQTSHAVHVRIRAWKSSSLPEPDFSQLDVVVEAGSPDVNKTYVEVEHGLGEYPGLVKVRTQLLDGLKIGYLSDAIGASLVTFSGDPTSETAHVVHGFNNHSLRVWISSAHLGLLFKGTDGYKISTTASIGRLEIFAWRTDTLPPLIEKTTQLGPNIANETFEMSLVAAGSEMFVQAWAESLNGPNAGYRFPGSGSLAYAETSQDPVCTYGGLMYGYTQDKLRFWRPSNTGSAGIICISSAFGHNTNTQREEDASIVVSVWTSRRGAPEWKEVENKCIHTVL